MGFKDKLARMPSPASGGASAPVRETEGNSARDERVARLRERLLGIGRGVPRRPAPTAVAVDDGQLPGVCEKTSRGPLRVIRQHLEAEHHHGDVPVASALDATGEDLGALALDPGLETASSADLLYIDTETTGLAGGAGTVPFLIGMAWFEQGRLLVEQLLLCGLGQEAPMLERLTQRLSTASAVVTYNGKSFDWPLLRSRYVLNRLDVPSPFPHFDLLHACRRVYRRRLTSLRLVAVEREALGHERVDDIDGALIPSRYFSFLRGGGLGLIEPVLTHNVHDLVALAAILGQLSEQWRTPHDDEDARDRLSIAEVALRHGDVGRAQRYADAAVTRARDSAVAADALTLAARLARRAGDFEGAVGRYGEALGLATDRLAEVHLALAKLYEHQLRRPVCALEHAGLCAAAEPAEAHARRIGRLERQIARRAGSS